MKYHLASVIWEFTLDCNLRCQHCGSAAGIPRPDELNTEECLKLCEDLAQLRCGNICLMGGEPFLRDDCFLVAQTIRDLGIGLTFVSNGVLLERYLPQIVSVAPSVVGISIDGLQATHEHIRGKGSWRPALAAIEALVASGVQTTVITTISKWNFRELPALKDLLLDKKVNWQLQVAMPFGNFSAEQVISPEEFYATALFIGKMRLHHGKQLPTVGAHDYGYYSSVLPRNKWQGCTAGISSLGITSNGNVVGCLSMGNDRFIEANVRQRSIIAIWNDPSLFAYNRQFSEAQLGPNCRECRHRKKCKGGCQAMSYTLSHHRHNDPYCFYAIEKQF